MATSKRDVTLGIGVETFGEENLRSFAESVRALGKSGDAAAPEFTRLANELDRLAEQANQLDTFKRLTADVERLALAQQAAARQAAAAAEGYQQHAAALVAAQAKQKAAQQAVDDARLAYVAQRGELRTLTAAIAEAGQASVAQTSRQRELRAAIESTRLVQSEAGIALRKSKEESREAAAELKVFEGQQTKTAAASTRASQALGEQAKQLGDVRGTLEAAGVSVVDLAAAEDRLRQAQQAIVTGVGQLRKQQTLEQIEADRLARAELQGLAAAQERGAAAAAAELAELKESEEWARRYAAALRAAAEAAKVKALADERAAAAAAAAKVQRDEQAEADRLAGIEARGLAEAQQRAAAAAESELAAIRESERFMERYAAQLRETAVAEGRLRASTDELSRAFGVTGVRSMQAIEAEAARVSRALATLEAQQRAGAISAQDLARATTAAGARLQQLQNEIQRVPAAANGIERLGAQVNGLASRFGALSATVATAAVAFKPLLDATIQLDQMTRSLTAVTGSSAEAGRQIEFLRNVAQRSGQAVSDVGVSYSKFVASATTAGVSLQTTQKVFSAVALAAGNLGLSSDQSKRALEALSQMASKGTVSMEELRQQLGDALPGVFASLAGQLGLTTSQLNKLVESGGLLAEDALPAIANGLMALGPASGTVEGIVAEFNRFKNVVVEAGTVFTTGPFGAAIGFALKGIGEAIQYVSIGVATMSEAFRLAGTAIYESVQLIATRDMPAFTKAMATATEESSARLNGLISRFNGTADASISASGAVAQLAVASKAAAPAITGAAVAAEKATPAVAGYGKAVSVVEASSTSAAKAVPALGKAVAAVSEELTGAAKSSAAMRVQHDGVIKASEGAAAAATKHAQAVRESSDATVKAVALAGNDVATKEAQARAAADVAEAAEAQAAADARVASQMLQSRDLYVAQLEREGKSAAAIRDATKALDEKILKTQADAEKSIASAEAARAEATARAAAAEALRDNSARYDEFASAVDRARGELERLRAMQAAGLATQTQVTEALAELSRRQTLVADSLRDEVANRERAIAITKAQHAGISATLTVREAEAHAAVAVARATGDVRAAAEAEVRVKEVLIERTRAAARAKTEEAEAQIRKIEADRAEAEKTGTLTAAKQHELEVRLLTERAKITEAKASDAVVRGIEAEIRAMRERNAVAAAGNEQRNAAAGSFSGDPGKYKLDPKGGDKVAGDPYGRTQAQVDALAGNTTGVDNSLQFVLREKYQAGTLTPNDLSAALAALSAAKESAYLTGTSQFSSFAAVQDAQQWVNTLQQIVDSLQSPGVNPGTGAGAGGLGGGNGGSSGTVRGGGGGTTGTAGAAAATPSAATTQQAAARTVNININGQSTQVQVASDADARALESLLRTIGDAASRTGYGA